MTTQPQMFTYNGFKITSRMSDQGTGDVAVFDPRFKRNPAIFRTTSLDKATQWVDAYRDGAQWAVDAALH